MFHTKRTVVHKSTKMWITLWVSGITDTKTPISQSLLCIPKTAQKTYFTVLIWKYMAFN